jgi:hypothetical protein
MNLSRILLRAAWITVGLAVIVAWGVMAFMTAMTFLFAYGNPPDSYTGQMDDRQAAWSFLIVLAVLSAIVVITVVWPLTRWQRRRHMPGTVQRDPSVRTVLYASTKKTNSARAGLTAG